MGEKKSSFGHLLFSLFFCSMPQNIPLPFYIHTKTVSSYETFWNSEHIRVYESHSVATVKERNAMVSARWQLDQAEKVGDVQRWFAERRAQQFAKAEERLHAVWCSHPGCFA